MEAAQRKARPMVALKSLTGRARFDGDATTIGFVPLLIGQTGLVSRRSAVALPASGGEPRGESMVGFINPLESHRSRPLDAFQNRG